MIKRYQQVLPTDELLAMVFGSFRPLGFRPICRLPDDSIDGATAGATAGSIAREWHVAGFPATFMRNPKYCAFFTGIDLQEMYRNCQKCTHPYVYNTVHQYSQNCCNHPVVRENWLIPAAAPVFCMLFIVHHAVMSLRKMQLPSTWNGHCEVAISRVGGSPTRTALTTNYWLMDKIDKIDRKRLLWRGKAPFQPPFSNEQHSLEKAKWNVQDVRFDVR